METFISDLSGKEYPVSEKVSARTIRHSILDLIRSDKPEFTHDSVLADTELNEYRGMAIEHYLKKEIGELSEPELQVLHAINSNQTLTDKIDGDDENISTFGQRIADRVATFGGSWTFILSFCGFLAVWILVNIIWLTNKGFDPYPFILLNLILSCIAALQAPVIMMSQNRQEDKDRDRARKDYMVNLKSEVEIRTLHEKVDHFITDQQQEIIDLQKMQLKILKEILHKS
jgi:uncharacterized membrane protein